MEKNNKKFYFEGSDYCASLDEERLGLQIVQIYKLMKDNKWRTLPEIEKITGYMTSSIAAQLRNFRKPRFGSLKVLKRRRGDASFGLFEYKLLPKE